jgi:hypothetical protein
MVGDPRDVSTCLWARVWQWATCLWVKAPKPLKSPKVRFGRFGCVAQETQVLRLFCRVHYQWACNVHRVRDPEVCVCVPNGLSGQTPPALLKTVNFRAPPAQNRPRPKPCLRTVAVCAGAGGIAPYCLFHGALSIRHNNARPVLLRDTVIFVCRNGGEIG